MNDGMVSIYPVVVRARRPYCLSDRVSPSRLKIYGRPVRLPTLSTDILFTLAVWQDVCATDTTCYTASDKEPFRPSRLDKRRNGICIRAWIKSFVSAYTVDVNKEG